jgi:hypothetical protein
LAFGTATVVTTSGKVTAANRLQTTRRATRPSSSAWAPAPPAAARTAVVGDTALSTEVETRATGTESIVTVTNANDAYQTQGTITATAGRAVDEAGHVRRLDGRQHRHLGDVPGHRASLGR